MNFLMFLCIEQAYTCATPVSCILYIRDCTNCMTVGVIVLKSGGYSKHKEYSASGTGI